MSEDELIKVQNQHGIHLCPSRSEGWGHCIVEAMSCSAVVLTTDGPPMNELVAAERGILVPWSQSSPRHLGTCFEVDPAALELAIERLIVAPTAEKESMGRAAREWYVMNDERFRRRFVEVVKAEFFGPTINEQAAA